MTSNEWQRLRAGFTVQGPYRSRRTFIRQLARVCVWLAAFATIGALMALGV